MEVLTKNAEETKEFGRKFANKLTGGEVVALSGDLGSGKTTFVQGLAEGLGIKERILSPTFVLVRQYAISDKQSLIPKGIKKKEMRCFYHVDLYRLEGDVEKELKGLGMEEVWGDSGNVVAIEWAEKVKGVLPESTIWVRFEYLDRGRKIKIT